FEIDESNVGGHLDHFVTVKVCEEKAQTSCITVHRAHFSEDPVQDLFPGLAAIITRDFADVPNTILDGGLVYQATMVDHDPIRCEDVTGRFKAPGCAGKLKLDYRCLNMVKLETFEVFTAAGSYIVTRTD
ncbi:MAG TPA: hypothetical protein VFX30_14050, partial [bacterium]|nr:hypothetical protein [bacterium]